MLQLQQEVVGPTEHLLDILVVVIVDGIHHTAAACGRAASAWLLPLLSSAWLVLPHLPSTC